MRKSFIAILPVVVWSLSHREGIKSSDVVPKLGTKSRVQNKIYFIQLL